MPVMNFYGVCVCSSPAELMASITASLLDFQGFRILLVNQTKWMIMIPGPSCHLINVQEPYLSTCEDMHELCDFLDVQLGIEIQNQIKLSYLLTTFHM